MCSKHPQNFRHAKSKVRHNRPGFTKGLIKILHVEHLTSHFFFISMNCLNSLWCQKGASAWLVCIHGSLTNQLNYAQISHFLYYKFCRSFYVVYFIIAVNYKHSLFGDDMSVISNGHFFLLKMKFCTCHPLARSFIDTLLKCSSPRYISTVKSIKTEGMTTFGSVNIHIWFTQFPTTFKPTKMGFNK